MAVHSVKERFQARRSSYRDGKMVHAREWLVTCDDPNDGTAVALTAVPPPGSRHNKDRTAVLTGLECRPHENSDRIFLIEGEYTTSSFGLPANPLSRKPEISYGATEGTQPYFIDQSTPDPKPVVNSAGDAFESYLEKDVAESTITITVNEATFTPVYAAEIAHTINQDVVTIDGVEYAERTLKVSAPTATKITEQVEGEGGTIASFTYYRVVYTVRVKPDKWEDKPLDVGLNELLPDPNDATKPKRLRPICDSAGLPVKRPWPLDGEGKRKKDPTDMPKELTFKPYKAVNWAGLKPFMPATWAA